MNVSSSDLNLCSEHPDDESGEQINAAARLREIGEKDSEERVMAESVPGVPDWCEVKVEGAAVLLLQPSRLIRPPVYLLPSKEPGEQIIHSTPNFIKFLLFYLPFIRV